jgi:hypothetical protein
MACAKTFFGIFFFDKLINTLLTPGKSAHKSGLVWFERTGFDLPRL